MPQKITAELLADAIRQTLAEGKSIELEGLGVFHPGSGAITGDRFVPDSAPKVFMSYVSEDLDRISPLYDRLLAAGFNPWLDKRNLMPGQDWARGIARAIEVADFFVACFSTTAVGKRGHFPVELRSALQCAERMPLDDMFLIPVRLEPCTLPRRISAQLHYVDLFPNWEAGVNALVRSIRDEWKIRLARRIAA